MLTSKQEKFAFNVAVKGMTYHDAYINAYNTGNMKPAVIDVRASELANTGKIAVRIKEKRAELEGPEFLSQAEYIKGLTDIYRTKITDFQTCGADGTYIDIGPEHPQAGSVAEIVSSTKYDENGSSASVVTRVKLHDKLQAGRDIAKIKGWWKEESGNTTIINVDKVLIDARNTLEGKINSLSARLGAGEVSQES